MGDKQGFAAEVKATFEDRTIQTFWWYIAFETEKKNAGPIVFMGAAILEGPTYYDAVSEAYTRRIAPRGSSVRKRPVQIPEGKLPPPEYRNRLLTKEEVQTIWPEVV